MQGSETRLIKTTKQDKQDKEDKQDKQSRTGYRAQDGHRGGPENGAYKNVLDE